MQRPSKKQGGFSQNYRAVRTSGNLDGSSVGNGRRRSGTPWLVSVNCAVIAAAFFCVTSILYGTWHLFWDTRIRAGKLAERTRNSNVRHPVVSQSDTGAVINPLLPGGIHSNITTENREEIGVALEKKQGAAVGIGIQEADRLEAQSLLAQPPEFDKDGMTRLHLVFSTDCTPYQHWQSYLLFYSALKVGQPGRVTRIVSGCDDDEAKQIADWHEKHIRQTMSPNFGLHLTPRFSTVMKDKKEAGNYVYFNKPHGLKHWLEKGAGMGVDPKTGNPVDEDLVVILTDPDMVLLRPIGIDFSDETDLVLHKEYDRKFRVEHGHPFAQKYGLGAKWQEFDLDKIAGERSPAKQVTGDEAAKHYPVGPPYIATSRDMYNIAKKWSDFAPEVHAQYPYLLAEMYAYCIAAAHLKLPHQLIDSLMVSDTGAGEGWPFVDKMKADDVCYMASNPNKVVLPLPSVMHYCQRYMIGKWFFGKRKMPVNFFSCEHALLRIPEEGIADKYDWKIAPGTEVSKNLPRRQAVREAFMICGLVAAANEAGEFFKRNHCRTVKQTRTDKSLSLWELFL